MIKSLGIVCKNTLMRCVCHFLIIVMNLVFAQFDRILDVIIIDNYG